MKRFNKLLCFMLVFITVMAVFCTVSFAATIGQTLTKPEAEWQRIDDKDSKFWYTNLVSGNDLPLYGGSAHYLSSNPIPEDTNVVFKFYGTKLRLITTKFTNYTQNLIVNIDGTNSTPINLQTSLTYQNLVYEITNLSSGVHSVKIYSTDSYRWAFDAIDIDDNGYLIDFYAPTNLKATPESSAVDLSWDSVEGATNYIVKRSLTSGGPYEEITTTSAITYTDRDVTNGTTYYYVVTSIVNGVESDPSNEASATPTAPVVAGNGAILEITMVTGEIKEYDLIASELQSFLTWYDGRSNGADKAYYMISKKNNIKPFLSRKEYIAFDKISSFEVKEYVE